MYGRSIGRIELGVRDIQSQSGGSTNTSIHPFPHTYSHPLRDVIVACAYNQTSPRDKSESHAERDRRLQ